MASGSQKAVSAAVQRDDAGFTQRLLNSGFALAFRGLVYAQIWEDPAVDMEALAITPDSRIVTIASGGCNVLSYLTANPERIVAVDLNTAHVALNRLKLTAARTLPDYDHFRRFFGDADSKANVAAYHRYIAPALDAVSRDYWEGRDIIGRRRIGMFARGAYRSGLLGTFITAAHFIARVHGVDPRELLAANDMDAQRAVFDQRMAPLFDRKAVRWLTKQRASLFGLGIPPAQYDALAGDSPMADVLRKRLEKLACGFDLKQNYFAWQAFGRGYSKTPDAPLPPYLEAGNYASVADRADRVDVIHANMISWLSAQPDASLDRYILLDAQDWMDDATLTALWTEITRTARPNARVLFRTAGEPTILPGRVPDAILSQWAYRAEASADYSARDRSSIYGGVHLYVLGDA